MVLTQTEYDVSIKVLNQTEDAFETIKECLKKITDQQAILKRYLNDPDFHNLMIEIKECEGKYYYLYNYHVSPELMRDYRRLRDLADQNSLNY